MTDFCPTCGAFQPDGVIPPEPPFGTWVKDRYGAASLRFIDSDGRDGWAPGRGFYAGGKWKAMWAARGPLVECGPYGKETS